MKKAGIITLHFSINFGAVLQCVALSEALKKHQIQVKVINYYPRYAHYYWDSKKSYIDSLKDAIKAGKGKKENSKKNSLIIRCVKSLKYVYFFNKDSKSYKTKCNAFKKFIDKHLILTDEYRDLEQLKDISFDILISGSDQVWNSNYTNYSFDKAYFLKFGKPDATRLAYAVSTHMYEEEEDWKEIISLSEEFNRISVRERKVCNKLNSFYGENRVCVTLDPTLLLTADEWTKFEPEEQIEKDYILIYCLKEKEKCLYYTNSCLRDHDLIVIDVSPKHVNESFSWRGNCGPDSFLKLFHNATYVVTDSFHGTVFSIIYNRLFVSIVNGQADTRISDLLDTLGISSRCKRNLDVFPCEPIDYNAVNHQLDTLREESIKFLFCDN